jgi:cyclopropane fatty-acyl-phospholipid synthase-like methyltransferase
LERGIDVLDVGCGAGLALNELARKFPHSRFVGYDFSDEAIAAARREAKTRGLTNLKFEVRDVANLDQRAAFDLVTAFDAIHDQRDPGKVLSEIQSALREDGIFLMQDIAASTHLQNNIGHPVGPFLYTISTMHCMTVSLALGGAGLGTCWGEEMAQQMLSDAGFAGVKVERLAHDIMNNYYIATRN